MRECPTVNKLAPERKGLAYTCRRSIGYTRERASRIGLPSSALPLAHPGAADSEDLVPTETVYGVAVAVKAFSDAVPQDTSEFPSWSCDPQATVNGAAVPALGTGYRRIFTLKQRELTQTVAWLVDGVEALDRYGVDIPEDARVLARRCWPGALTIVIKAAPCVPTFMRAADDTVALRASASPVVQALIRACGSPLACTSANTHGAPSPASFAAVEGRILEGVDVAVDASETPCRDASTIVSFQHGGLQILRQGALPASEIERVLSDPMQ